MLLGGMSYTEACSLSRLERKAMKIIFGSIRGGKWNMKKNTWDEAPSIM